MTKLIAILNVVAWSGFWAFGYLALTADASMDGGEMVVAAFLAATGGGVGMLAYLWLAQNSGTPRGLRTHRHNETNGEAG